MARWGSCFSSGFVARSSHTDGRFPLPSFPVLKLGAAALLVISEQQNAIANTDADNTASIPNNFGDDKPRSPWTGVILDEVGLGTLAEAMLLAIVQPLSRILFPEWDSALLDSYHAFSLHVGTSVSHRRRSTTVEHRVVGDRLPSHNDICETSINICLGRNFSGSAMQFQASTEGRACINSAASAALEHVPGRGSCASTTTDKHTDVRRVRSGDPGPFFWFGGSWRVE